MFKSQYLGVGATEFHVGSCAMWRCKEGMEGRGAHKSRALSNCI